MASADRKLAFGVVGQNVRVYTAQDRSSYIDLSPSEAIETLGRFGSTIKSALGEQDQELDPADKRAARLRLIPEKFSTGCLKDGHAFMAFSFTNFVSVLIPVPDAALTKTAADLKQIADTPLDIRRQETN